jgi:hypothetical protein
MRAISRTLIAVAATLMIAAVPVMAFQGNEGMTGIMSEDAMPGQQNESVNSRECLLVAKNCPTEALQSRAQRIQTEINRGTDVYTKDELRKLQNELEDVQKEIDADFDSGGA